MNPVEIFLLSTSALLLLCVLASKASGKLGIPTLVVFLGVGILAGSEGAGGIQFDNAYYAQSLGIIALAYILFSGGLDTSWKDIKPIIKPGVSLATLGVFLTCILVGIFNYYFLNFSLLEGLLIGAIISSTDAGAVFTVLRSRSIHLKGNLKPLLELESGSNDPMAVFLTTLVLSLMQSPESSSTLDFITLFISQMIIGLSVGYAGGKIAIFSFNKIKLEFDGLYSVMSLATVILIYTLTQSLRGNGFLAVYVAGVVLGNSNFIHKKSLTLLHDGVSWLMQSALFLTLGLLLYPSNLIHVASTGIILSAFLILFARPISVFLSLAFTKISIKEKLLISWVGLRGSVPIVMATYPLVAGVGKADIIFNLVFFIALTSLIFQGSFVPLVAKMLKVQRPEQISPRPSEIVAPFNPQKDMTQIIVPEWSSLVNKSIIDLKLADDLLIILIERKGNTVIPRGGTVIESSDRFYVLGDDSAVKNLRARVMERNEISEA